MSKPLPALALGAALLVVLASGCALRPRYTELVPRDAQEGQALAFALVDRRSEKPLPNVPIVIGEGRARVRTQTDSQGVFVLPVARAMRSTNPVLEVSLPRGVHAYDVRPIGQATAQQAEETEPSEDMEQGPGPLRQDPTGVLTGCQVEPTPTGVSVECPELMAVVAHGEEGQTAVALADQMVEEFTTDFRESFASAVEREELQLEVAGVERRALRFTGQLPDGQQVVGTVVSLEPAEEGSRPRALLCLFVGEETRPCGPLLSSLAERLPEPGVYGP